MQHSDPIFQPSLTGEPLTSAEQSRSHGQVAQAAPPARSPISGVTQLSDLRVLLLAYSRGGIAIQVLYCLAELGATVFICGSSQAKVAASSRYCRKYVSVPLRDPAITDDDLAAAINDACRENAIDVVLPGDDGSTRTLVRLAARIKSPVFSVPTPEAFSRLNDKWAFHQLCTEVGVPVPRTKFIPDKQAIDVEDLSDSPGFPMVIKPTSEGNANGVVILQTQDDLRRRILNNPAYRYKPLLAQEFVDGRDVDYSLLAQDGQEITGKVQWREDGEIVFGSSAELADACRQLIAACGYSGPAHFDARVRASDGAHFLIECNPRFWASITAALWCGTNFVELGLSRLFDLPLPAQSIRDGARSSSPIRTLSRLLRLRAAPWSLSRADRRFLIHALSDPLPLAQEEYLRVRRWIRDRRLRS